jgi:hypothetical protein
MRKPVAESPESRRNRAIARQSSSIVVTSEPARHAGGRGFESRRSRQNPAKQACCVVGSDARSWPTTRTFSREPAKRFKTAQRGSAPSDFRPIGRVQLGHEGGVRLHQTTGGQGHTTPRRHCGKPRPGPTVRAEVSRSAIGAAEAARRAPNRGVSRSSLAEESTAMTRPSRCSTRSTRKSRSPFCPATRSFT